MIGSGKVYSTPSIAPGSSSPLHKVHPLYYEHLIGAESLPCHNWISRCHFVLAKMTEIPCEFQPYNSALPPTRSIIPAFPFLSTNSLQWLFISANCLQNCPFYSIGRFSSCLYLCISQSQKYSFQTSLVKHSSIWRSPKTTPKKKRLFQCSQFSPFDVHLCIFPVTIMSCFMFMLLLCSVTLPRYPTFFLSPIVVLVNRAQRWQH